MSHEDWMPRHPALVALLSAFMHESVPIYLVGGYVRDTLADWTGLGTDIDIVLEQPAIPIAKRVADRLGWAYFALDEGRDTARLIFRPDQRTEFVCDIASIRGDTIEADLYNRDFTINALAVALYKDGSTKLIDVSSGLDDIANRCLRRITAYSLPEDALRLLRAIRLAAQFGLSLELETRKQIERLAGTIRTVSPERIRDELWKMMTTVKPQDAVLQMSELGLLSHVLPELAATEHVAQSHPHYQDVFAHTLSTIQNAAMLRDWIKDGSKSDVPAHAAVKELDSTLGPLRLKIRQQMEGELAAGRSRLNWLVWCALLHDIGKPPTQSSEPAHQASDHTGPGSPVRYRFIEHPMAGAKLAQDRLESLHYSRLESRYGTTVVGNHMRPHFLHASFINATISKRACYRFFRDSALNRNQIQVGLDILLLALCDYQAIYADSPPPSWAEYTRHVCQLVTYLFEAGPLAPHEAPPLVDGMLLIQRFARPAGPWVGSVLEKLREAQMSGEIATTDEALEIASQWLPQEDGGA